MTQPLSTTLAQAASGWAVVRKGVLTQVYPTYVKVRIGNATVATTAGWLGHYRPIIGDTVLVANQGAMWVVLGSFGSTVEDNWCRNGSFESGAVGAVPPNWTLSVSAGSPTLVTGTWGRDDIIDGPQVAVLTSPGAASVSCEVISDPIPVFPGQQWAVSGAYRTSTNFSSGTNCTVQLFATFYTGVSLGSALVSFGSGLYPVTRGMDWQILTSQGNDGRTAPSTATVLRLRLQFTWTAAAGDVIYLDRMIARSV